MNHCTTHFSPADAGDASVRSPLSRIAVAAALVMAGISTNSYALGFGKLHVQSALGQPLHAEVEILDARPGELRAGLAPAANYSKRGLDYNPIVSSIRSSVQRINGRTVLRLTSDRPRAIRSWTWSCRPTTALDRWFATTPFCWILPAVPTALPPP